MKRTIKITFDNEELEQEFLGWLSDGGGEQEFFESCEVHDIEVASISYEDDEVHVKAR